MLERGEQLGIEGGKAGQFSASLRSFFDSLLVMRNFAALATMT